MSKIKNKKIKEEINKINRIYKIRIKGIYKFNLSKETKKANALFTGFGKAKRILIADNLVNNFTDEEIIAVYLHELGHLKKRHMLKTLITSLIMLAISLFIISKIDLKNYLDYTNIFKLAFYLSVFQFLTMTIENIFSRKREKEADLFAKKVLGNEDELISALKKLEKQNLVTRNPNKFIEFIFYSHPSIKNRIKYLIKE
ncbi:MAG: M48 family metalloprotease [Bacillota bacterium]|nr:M48 family metalloprotease [Bacillota bacterium]